MGAKPSSWGRRRRRKRAILTNLADLASGWGMGFEVILEGFMGFEGLAEVLSSSWDVFFTVYG